jgi:hypothetical protein
VQVTKIASNGKEKSLARGTAGGKPLMRVEKLDAGCEHGIEDIGGGESFTDKNGQPALARRTETLERENKVLVSKIKARSTGRDEN